MTRPAPDFLDAYQSLLRDGWETWLRQVDPKAFGLSTYAVVDSPELEKEPAEPAAPTPTPPVSPAPSVPMAEAAAKPKAPASVKKEKEKTKTKTQPIADPDDLGPL